MAAEVWQSISPYLFIAQAAGLVLLGYVVGRILERLTRGAAQALLDRLGSQGTGVGAIGAAAVARTVPALVGRLVYWIIFLVAAAASVEVLGFPVVSQAVERLGSYVPGALTALVIFFIGV